ncbi:uncharacterized protein LOC131857036 [Cryptomeria japonica]|uniref:uncharacterized protein LOC131857036 n=1 Tax=Cryptomeria japonica TaxID=3369 RepID=UPI0027D9FA80|nr:uncharacterized protein LOC131857036 [Cryptomeria japonica]
MMSMMKELKADKEGGREGKELWCTDCKTKGHTKGSCPHKAFCDTCQVMGHSIKECTYNLKTLSTQVLFAQPDQVTPPATLPKPAANSNASPGGYRNNRQGNNRSNNNTPRSRIQYNAKGRPMIQCRKCNEWSHFARECQNGGDAESLLCKWCVPRNHEDIDCPRQKGVNMLEVEGPREGVLAITRLQNKTAMYPDPCTEKERL